MALIKNIFGKTGVQVIVESNFWCDYGYNISVGENFYMNHNGVILDCAKVEFGDNVFIGPNCGFYTAGHPIEIDMRNEGLEYAKPIKVGNNVWIGGNVVVLPGVTIGTNVTIGAGSVVTKDIPSNCVAYGNPCRVVKEL
jgi:acetyltransferase-like isoleucine patch superfamily enzyme